MKIHIKFIFSVFGLLVVFDMLFIIFSSGYRDIFGQVSGMAEITWRIIADIVMVLFYGLVFWKLRKGICLPRLMICHGVFYSLLGVAMCIPWVGYFFAPLSPIGLLFLASIIWIQDGYYLSLAIALMFIIFNLHLIQYGLKERKNLTSQGEQKGPGSN